MSQPTTPDHRIRLVPDEVPHVYPVADAVVLQLTADQARVLAGVLAHYDVLTETYPRVLEALLEQSPEEAGKHQAIIRTPDYDPAVWHHTLVELHTARARLETRMVPLISVGPEVKL